MIKRSSTIFIILMLLFSSIPLIDQEEVVQASDPVPMGGMQLDRRYVYNITRNLSDVIYKAYDPIEEYAKGRAFGSRGELYAKDRIYDNMSKLGLWTTVDPVQSGPSDIYKNSWRLHGFDDILDVNERELIVYNTTSEEQFIIEDTYISPRWNGTFLNYIPVLRFFAPDENELTYTAIQENLDVLPRDKSISTCVKTLIIDNINGILNNASITNYSTFITYIFNKMAEEEEFSWEEILQNQTKAQQLPWYNESQGGRCCPFVEIDENPAFNPESEFYPLLQHLLTIHKNKPLLNTIFNFIYSARLQIELLLKLIMYSNPCVPEDLYHGLILYDYTEDTYDHNTNLYHAFPIIYINRALGTMILNDYEHFTVDYLLDQQWKTEVESYNVIGQINGINQEETVLLSCLYDSWYNQGTADAATGIGILLGIAKYFHDNNIQPKCNVRFAAFAGEEYGVRGAYSYEMDHRDDNDEITTVLDLNQLGFQQTEPDPRIALYVVINQ
jgi:hypothetical protein